jgi:hypothetical protein
VTAEAKLRLAALMCRDSGTLMPANLEEMIKKLQVSEGGADDDADDESDSEGKMTAIIKAVEAESEAEKKEAPAAAAVAAAFPAVVADAAAAAAPAAAPVPAKAPAANPALEERCPYGNDLDMVYYPEEGDKPPKKRSGARCRGQSRKDKKKKGKK